MSFDVLLVDDDTHIRALAQIALEDVAGWNVVAVQSGELALQKLQEMSPRVILLDMMMPGMDGKATLAKIKESGFAGIPVIFMTAKVQPKELEQFHSLGVAGVITKPFDPMKLADEIQEILKT